MTREEIIAKYIQIISSRYKWYSGIATASWVIPSLIQVLFDLPDGFLFILEGIVGLGLGFMIYINSHYTRMLNHFDQRYDDPEERLEKYLQEKAIRWDKSQLIRTGLMAVLLLIMLMMLVFFKDKPWAGLSATLFIALILAFYIKHWLDFQDGILMQDIDHSLRDQPSA